MNNPVNIGEDEPVQIGEGREGEEVDGESVGDGQGAAGGSAEEGNENNDGDISPPKRQRRNEPVPYQGATIVYDNNGIQAVVRSVESRERTQYRFHDHLFEIRLLHQGKRPFFIDCTHAIIEAIVSVLTTLQNTYDATQRRQAQVAVIERSMTSSSLNTSFFDLNTPVEEIVGYIFSMMRTFLRSFQTLKIDNSFKINVKVLSLKHMANLKNKHVYNLRSR